MKLQQIAAYTFLTLGIWAAGCANLTNPARMHELVDKKLYWFDYDATRRGAILTYRDGRDASVVTCAEPAPDVALGLTSKLLAETKITPPSGKFPEIEAKAEADFRSNVVDLAKRSQTIMFVREAMYRLCEQALNGHLPQGTVESLYKLIIEASVKLADAELTREKGRLAEAVKDEATRKFMEDLFLRK